MQDIKQRMLESLAQVIGKTLDGFDERTGRFMSEPDGPPAPDAKPGDLGWCPFQQDVIYPLAVLYATPGTQYHGDERVVNMALRGGDAIRDAQYADGQVEFIKNDGSRWGPTYAGWTNYAWLETYDMLREHLGDERDARWAQGLRLAHDGQAEKLKSLDVHNIQCWNAMSCHRAGAMFNRPDWQAAGEAMIHAVVKAQHPDGYWLEHGGPTTLYNYVYLHGLGLHYKFTNDSAVLPALEAAAEFHQTFTYPSGAPIDTIDGRVKYLDHIMLMGWVGLSATAKGRRLVRYMADHFDAERDIVKYQGGSIGSIIRDLIVGDEQPINLDRAVFRETFADRAIVSRQGPWYACLSAYTSEPVVSRWGQDRQSFVSLWHDDFGLVLGGGNSRDQAQWSTFVANGRLLPDSGELVDNGIALMYGPVRCLLRVQLEAGCAIIEANSEHGDALQQFVVQVKAGDTVRTACGRETTLGDDAVHWVGDQLGDWLEARGCRIELPRGATFSYPTAPFNPYAADGAAAFGSQRGLLSVRVEQKPVRWIVRL